MLLKKLWPFYMVIFTPLIILAIGLKFNYFSNNFTFWSLMFYALIYHPIISGIRLLKSKKIKKKEFLLNFIPFWNAKYFEFLFFNVDRL
jgi:hypothetical protein